MNLRNCTNAQNQGNQKKREGTTSRFKGVCWHKRDRKWSARIRKNGHRHNLGYFDDELDAAGAYNVAALELFGEFALLNIIDEFGAFARLNEVNGDDELCAQERSQP